jgi:NAD(P) transhydrogenase subunit alpha
VVHHDVTMRAPLNLPASMPEHASELYARNVVALLELMLDDDGALGRPVGGRRGAGGSCVTRTVRTGAVRWTSGGLLANSRSWCWPGSSASR